ncbi:uncharacterized protein LOC135810405 [Sycon ciliatum]|uniref:uncharacterized protein LOC135810405 n=1 Tax=Sycon ciliatum TaxID=27933 RepID=UPI0031F60E51
MALNPRCRAVVYRGFVRPILEYGMLVWMSAVPSTLAKLTAIQRRALHVIGDGCYLPSLDIRRSVAALCYLFKLHYLTGPDIITALLPPPAPAPVRARTRASVRTIASHHPLQLTKTVPPQSRNNVLRSFPHCMIDTWNCLPASILSAGPSQKSMQTFKKKVYDHLRQSDWDWATDRLYTPPPPGLCSCFSHPKPNCRQS